MPPRKRKAKAPSADSERDDSDDPDVSDDLNNLDLLATSSLDALAAANPAPKHLLPPPLTSQSSLPAPRKKRRTKAEMAEAALAKEVASSSKAQGTVQPPGTKRKRASQTTKAAAATAAESAPMITSTSILQREDIDLAQDSDEENSKIGPKKAKSGYDRVLDYFGPPVRGEKDPEGGPFLSFPCNWCHEPVRGSLNTTRNLKVHRDGSSQAGKSGQPGCRNRSEAVNKGANLPSIAADSRATGDDRQVTRVTYTFDNDILNQILMFWILRQALPWTRLEDNYLRAAFVFANPEARLYGHTWTAREAHRAYLDLSGTVISTLQNLDSKFSISSDVWTTPGNRLAFLGCTVTYIDSDWNYVTQHLTLKLVAWHHKGEWLAEPLIGILKKHGLYPKLLAQSSDSGSNNPTMAKAMHQRLTAIAKEEDKSFDWDPSTMSIKCFAHKVALIVNSGLDALGIVAPTPWMIRKSMIGSFPVDDILADVVDHCDDDIDDPMVADDALGDLGDSARTVGPEWYEIEGSSPQAPRLDPVSNPVPFTAPLPTDRAAPNHLDGLLKRLDYVLLKLTGSAQMRTVFVNVAAALGYVDEGLIAGYGIRWNVKWQSRHRGWKARHVIDEILRMDQMDDEEARDNRRSKKVGTLNPVCDWRRGSLLKILFTPDDWKLIRALNKELEHFSKLTLEMEGDGPTGSMVLRHYIKLQAHLENKLKLTPASAPFYPMFHSMLVQLKIYLKEAMKCDTLLMATMLHPSWRSAFFEVAFGATSPTTLRAKKLLQEHFDARKIALKGKRPGLESTFLADRSSAQDGPDVADSDSDSEDNDNEENDPMLHLHQPADGQKTFDEIGTYQLASDVPDQAVSQNPHLALKWWRSHEGKYPVLASLARDYLSCSGTSCSVERTFSSAADVCIHDRGSLLPRTIERCVSCRMWLANGVPLGSGLEQAGRILDACIAADLAARHRKPG